MKNIKIFATRNNIKINENILAELILSSDAILRTIKIRY